jgi:tRNA A37 threonylcarbamoyladenosine dehydratase
MDTRRSYYLQSNQDDFSELDAETRQFDSSDVPYVTPANDNAPTKVRLAAHCRAFLRRLIALHRLGRPVA